MNDFIEKLETMYGCELDFAEKEDDIASKMKFKKKKKRKKCNVDDDLIEEQERLFIDAQDHMINSLVNEALGKPQTEFNPILDKSDNIQPSQDSKPIGSKVMIELEKKLSEQVVDSIDFDALKVNP